MSRIFNKIRKDRIDCDKENGGGLVVFIKKRLQFTTLGWFENLEG